MTEKEIKARVEEQLRREILHTWGLDTEQYACTVGGDFKGALWATFTRVLNKAELHVDDIYADDNGGLLQWAPPKLVF